MKVVLFVVEIYLFPNYVEVLMHFVTKIYVYDLLLENSVAFLFVKIHLCLIKKRLLGVNKGLITS